jgi:putative hemolysin
MLSADIEQNLPPGFSPPEPGLLGRLGTLDVRLARTEAEIIAAQQLRFGVFHGNGVGGADGLQARDADRFDAACDHLIVVDPSLPGPDHRRIVATCRLLPGNRTQITGGFYSDDEFALSILAQRFPDRAILEIGRSCVLPAYRSKRTVELLWQGIWAYCRQNGMDVMAGCASFRGTVPAAHALALSYLWHFRRACGEWDIPANNARRCEMDMMPAEAVMEREAIAAMPPLLKGYLRLGGRVGSGAVVDHAFGSTDVFVVLPVEWINRRYIAYFGENGERFAA